jgi:hypothetical protein
VDKDGKKSDGSEEEEASISLVSSQGGALAELIPTPKEGDRRKISTSL